MLLGAPLGVGALAQAVPPPNAAAQISFDAASGRLVLDYDGVAIFTGQARGAGGGAIRLTSEIGQGDRGALTQTIVLSAAGGAAVTLTGLISGSFEAFAAETFGPAQLQFPLIRTSSGPDHNLRNNAIYDRRFDWVLEGPAGSTLAPSASGQFQFSASGVGLRLVFEPRFYQIHRHLDFFQPWTYTVWPDPVAGWSSWWAYQDSITEADVRQVAQVFAAKLRDFGYTYIQLDDGYKPRDAYPLDGAATNAKFPSGLDGLAEFERSLGLKPAIWENVAVDDDALATAHPGWFLPGPDGAPRRAPWVGYGINGTDPAAVAALVTPTYAALHRMGYSYVKIDTLRHLLYDASYPDRHWLEQQGSSPGAAFRKVLQAARAALGRDTYLLACWGVLPETAGIADATRLGTDGFGPATLQQYNSFNNVVWRNDPDHVDLAPGEEILRPVEVSMAGAQLLLSDRAAVYADDARLKGARRSAPVLFTLPSQLYDFDPTATDNLAAGLRNSDGGANSGPIDAVRNGAVNPWWLMDISRSFENWSVLARLAYTPQPAATVRFADLGLDANQTYLVYEFWTRQFLGAFRGAFTAPGLEAGAARVYAVRRLQAAPQVLSTSRHITQGGVDLRQVHWDAAARTLSGTSAVVAGDPYQIVLHVPAGFTPRAAVMDGQTRPLNPAAGLATIGLTPARTGEVSWTVSFR